MRSEKKEEDKEIDEDMDIKMNCNTPKYTLVVFHMFRVFCRYKLKFS